MPVANVHLLKGHPREALREIIIGVSEAMSRILEAPEDRLFVWVTEHDHDFGDSRAFRPVKRLRQATGESSKCRLCR